LQDPAQAAAKAGSTQLQLVIPDRWDAISTISSGVRSSFSQNLILAFEVRLPECRQSDPLRAQLAQSARQPTKVFRTRKNREIGVSIKLRCAVANARLAITP